MIEEESCGVRKRRRIDNDKRRIELFAAALKCVQNTDEFDRIFSESCLTVVNLSNLMSQQQQQVRIKYKLTTANGPGVRAFVVDDNDARDDENDYDDDDDEDDDDDGDDVKDRRIEEDDQSRRNIFSALWCQITGGKETAESIFDPDTNCIRAKRRDVLAVASVFRFKACPEFRSSFIQQLAQFQDRVFALYQHIHLARCERSNHEACHIGCNVQDISVTTANDAINDAIKSLVDLVPSDPNERKNELFRAIVRQTWEQTKECSASMLTISLAIFNYSKRLYRRCAKLVQQLALVPGVTNEHTFHAHSIQLYNLMFVRTYETMRQINVNLQRVVHRSLLDDLLLSGGRGGSVVGGDEEVKDNGGGDRDDDDDYEDNVRAEEDEDNEDDDAAAEKMDRLIESDEDNRTQRKVRELLLGYRYYITGDVRKLTLLASNRIDFSVENTCEELVALDDTAWSIFLCIKMLYFERPTYRLYRFVRSIDRRFVEHGVELRPRTEVRSALQTNDVRRNVFEMEFLVRQIHEVVSAIASNSRRLQQRGGGRRRGLHHRRRRRPRYETITAAAPPVTVDEISADNLMKTVERDVNRLNDEQFQINERVWEYCSGWPFTMHDSYRFTYPYALLSNLSNFEDLTKIRECVSLYHQLLRVKFYRFVFRRRREMPPTGPNVVVPEQPENIAIPDLPSIYHSMQVNVAANEERERQIQSTLRDINEMMMDTS